MPTTPVGAMRFPGATDGPNGPLQIENLARDLQTVTLPRFTNASARDSAYTAAGLTPALGWFCVVAGVMQEHDGTQWIDIGSPAGWTTFTPTLRTAAGSPTVGNGSLIGRYRRLGKMIVVREFLQLGSTTNMGAGPMTFDLPFAALNDGSFQNLAVKAFVSDTKVYAGSADIAPGGTLCTPLLPRTSATTDMTSAQGANNAGAAGTGVPLVSGDFTFKAGSNISIFGIYEAA